jgi:hypothetical protein
MIELLLFLCAMTVVCEDCTAADAGLACFCVRQASTDCNQAAFADLMLSVAAPVHIVSGSATMGRVVKPSLSGMLSSFGCGSSSGAFMIPMMPITDGVQALTTGGDTVVASCGMVSTG